MSAAKPKKKQSTARKVATGAAKGAAKSAVAVGGETLGRGTRWTEDQVKLLLKTVDASGTAKEAFEIVAHELGKSAGTVAQKYYNLQKAATGGRAGAGGARRGRPAGSGTRSTAGRGATAVSLPSAAQLRGLTVDDLVGLAAHVKTEIDRRREELDAAAEALKG